MFASNVVVNFEGKQLVNYRFDFPVLNLMRMMMMMMMVVVFV
jgi:hypothetical protein